MDLRTRLRDMLDRRGLAGTLGRLLVEPLVRVAAFELTMQFGASRSDMLARLTVRSPVELAGLRLRLITEPNDIADVLVQLRALNRHSRVRAQHVTAVAVADDAAAPHALQACWPFARRQDVLFDRGLFVAPSARGRKLAFVLLKLAVEGTPGVERVVGHADVFHRISRRIRAGAGWQDERLHLSVALPLIGRRHWSWPVGTVRKQQIDA